MHQWHPFIINTNWHNERLNFMQMSHDAIGVLFTTALAKWSSLPAEKKKLRHVAKKLHFYTNGLQDIKCFLSTHIGAPWEYTSQVVAKCAIKLCRANLCNATYGFVSALL